MEPEPSWSTISNELEIISLKNFLWHNHDFFTSNRSSTGFLGRAGVGRGAEGTGVGVVGASLVFKGLAGDSLGFVAPLPPVGDVATVLCFFRKRRKGPRRFLELASSLEWERTSDMMRYCNEIIQSFYLYSTPTRYPCRYGWFDFSSFFLATKQLVRCMFATQFPVGYVESWNQKIRFARTYGHST